jgi:ABC-type uncharacterized transport system permease subunit
LIFCLLHNIVKTSQIFFFNRDIPERTGINILAFLFLTLGIGFQGLEGFSPVGSPESSLIILAWILMLMGQCLYFRLKTSLVFLLLNPLCVLLILSGWRLGKLRLISHKPFSEHLHIFLSLVSFAFILLAALTAIMFFFQEMKLKRKIKLAAKLPSLGLLERIAFNFDVLALFFLSGAIISGVVDQHERLKTHGTASTGIPLVVYFSLLTWAFLGLTVFLKQKKGWGGRRFAQANICLLTISLLTLLGGFH